MNKTNKIKDFVFLHMLLFMQSVSSVCSKLASQQEFLSAKFIMLYGILLAILVVYALLWQKVLKKMKLVTAYANKSITIIWGLIWGVLLFNETVTINKILGILVIILGVYFVVTGEEDNECTS